MTDIANGGLQRISRQTLASVIATQIRERVFDGTFPPGMQLNEVDLADRFATSRGPVREGMQRLIQEGLLRSEPHRGVFVPVLTEDDLDDIYFARAVLEKAAFQRLTGRQLEPEVTSSLDSIVRRMREAADRDDWTKVATLDLQFHESVVQAVGSERLSRMFRTLLAETRLCLNALTRTNEGRRDLVEEHADLLRLLDGGSDADVVSALDRHFGDAVASIKQRGDASPA